MVAQAIDLQSTQPREMRCFMVVKPKFMAAMQQANPRKTVGELLQMILDRYPEHVAQFRRSYAHDPYAVEQWAWDADNQRYYFQVFYLPNPKTRDEDLIGDD